MKQSLLFMICLLPTVHLYEPFKKNSQRSCNVLQHCRQLETQNKLRYLEFEKVAAAVVGILKIIIRIQFVEIWNIYLQFYIVQHDTHIVTLLNYKMFSSLPCRILKTNCQIWFTSTKKKCLAALQKRCPPVLWCVVIRFLSTK